MNQQTVFLNNTATIFTILWKVYLKGMYLLSAARICFYYNE